MSGSATRIRRATDPRHRHRRCQMTSPRVPLIERFMKYVHHEPMSGCWLWAGACCVSGHGHFWNLERMIGSHVFSYQTFVGEIPAGLSVLHRCDVRPCVNPDHLFLGTQGDNIRDMAAKGRGSRSRSGLPFGVSPHHDKGRFRATVTRNHRQVFVGSFDTAEEAHLAALAFKANLYMRGDA